MMKLLERFDQQKIDREPYRPAPVGVSSEEPRGGLSRFVVDPMLGPVYLQDVGMIFVESRDPANAVRREKFRFIQQVPEHAFQTAAVHEGKQPAPSFLPLSYFDMRANIRMVVDEPRA